MTTSLDHTFSVSKIGLTLMIIETLAAQIPVAHFTHTLLPSPSSVICKIISQAILGMKIILKKLNFIGKIKLEFLFY